MHTARYITWFFTCFLILSYLTATATFSNLGTLPSDVVQAHPIVPDAFLAPGLMAQLSTSTAIATDTIRSRFNPSESLLDRLVKDKPSVWGSKIFYVGMAILYVVLIALFLLRLLQLSTRADR